MSTGAKLSQSLLNFSSWNARKALAGWTASEQNIRLDAFVSAGVAVELLLKYLLSLTNPLLLADLKPHDMDSAFGTRLAFSGAPQARLADARSCTAAEALVMVHKFYPGTLHLDRGELAQLMKVRNSACHLAVEHDPGAALDAVFFMVQTFDPRPTGHADLVPWPFDGAQHDQARKFLEQQRDSRYELVRASIEKHRHDHVAAAGSDAFAANSKKTADSFYADQMQQYFDEESGPYLTGPATERHKCIACKAEGVVLCEAEGEVFDHPTVADECELGVVHNPFAYACSGCGLTLSSDALRTLEDAGDGWAKQVRKPTFISPFSDDPTP